MGKIHLLPDPLISQIAAGEVVERPASVVKELLENSLDAGATHCSIEIEQGGMKLIAVRDNGCGMTSEDARLAFSRHATSKIAAFSDLLNIKSFGFRGEALAAIASVAMVTMKTRLAVPENKNSGNESGIEIIYNGGKLESEKPIGCPPGTEIVVRNIFFNTPARRKFLKSETTEFGHIVETVQHAALAHPAVSFDLKHNGKIIFSAAQTNDSRERLGAILGKNFVQELLPVDFSTASLKIKGFIGRPGSALTSKRHQYLFINGRDVSDLLISRAVAQAFGTLLPGRSYPLFVLHFDLDPVEVDVNVHPRKLNVKFLEPQQIYRNCLQAISAALQKNSSGSFGQFQPSSESTAAEALEFTQTLLMQKRNPDGLFQETSSSSPTHLPTFPHTEIPSLFGQIANSYLLVFDEQGLAIIDQHAAHERILYEKFLAWSEKKNGDTQPLLFPLHFECARDEAVSLKEAMKQLSAIGFEFDEWSGNTFVISACPSVIQKENLEKIFRDFMDEMLAGFKTNKKIVPEKLLKTLACKAAIKFGMKLSSDEQMELLIQLGQTSNKATCPHGRPTRILISFEELEKRFLRKN